MLFERGHAVVLGVGEYRGEIPDLPKAEHEVGRITHVLTDPDRCAYPPSHVRSRVNPTSDEIRAELLELAATGPEDTVLVYFSGHGWSTVELGSEEPARNFLLGSDAHLENGELAGAVEGTELTELLRNIPAGYLAVFLDCCYSGGTGEVKGPGAAFKAGLSQHYYDDLSKSEGRAIIASSGPTQTSLDLPDMETSLFTHYLLEALEGGVPADVDGFLRILRIANFVSERVALRDNRQRPWHKVSGEDFAIGLGSPVAHDGTGNTARLVLRGSKWKLVQPGSPERPLSKDDLEGGLQVGEWRLRPAREKEAATRRISLDTTLLLATRVPRSQVEIRLSISPGRDYLWQFEFGLDEASVSDLHLVHVGLGLGPDELPATGQRALRPARPAKFEMDAPLTDTLWSHVQLGSAQGRWRSHPIEIPVRVAEITEQGQAP
jgi:hypothetical protein